MLGALSKMPCVRVLRPSIGHILYTLGSNRHRAILRGYPHANPEDGETSYIHILMVTGLKKSQSF